MSQINPDDIPANIEASSSDNPEAPLAVAPKTAESYLQTAVLLFRRYLATEQAIKAINPIGVDAYAFVAWLITLKPDISSSTWRQYKAAVRFSMKVHNVSEASARLAAEPQSGTLPRGLAPGPADKKKGFPAKEQELIIGWLHEKARNSKGARQSVHGSEIEIWRRPYCYGVTALWIRATVLTGLRPHEWRDAQLVWTHRSAGKPALVVHNAKSTFGRANGPFRTIPLDHLSSTDVQIIETHLGVCFHISARNKFDRLYDQCSDAIAEASRALWTWRETHYTLYSARHQFAANAKRVHSRESVAALMGHKSTVTASRHYARRIQGEGGSRGPIPTPLPEEVATVRIIDPPQRSRTTLSVKNS